MKQYFTKYLPVEGEITKAEVQKGVKLLCTKTVEDLRIEGKIYDACWLNFPRVDSDNGELFDSWGYISEKGEPQYIHWPHEMKKIKLFLCSRDIQVGDKARSIEFPEEEFTVSSIEMGSGKDHYPKELLVWNRKDEQVSYWRTLANTFKVIGEISPEVTWVKEGDEFEEDDWEFNRDYMMPPYVELKNKEGKFDYLK